MSDKSYNKLKSVIYKLIASYVILLRHFSVVGALWSPEAWQGLGGSSSANWYKTLYTRHAHTLSLFLVILAEREEGRLKEEINRMELEREDMKDKMNIYEVGH